MGVSLGKWSENKDSCNEPTSKATLIIRNNVVSFCLLKEMLLDFSKSLPYEGRSGTQMVLRNRIATFHINVHCKILRLCAVLTLVGLFEYQYH